jgi:hypothetical protein
MSTVIDLGKLRFQYRGAYVSSTQYEYNDVVVYGGDVFCYVNALATIGNAPTNATYWSRMVSGLNPRGAWSSATAYLPNDLVKHGGTYYRNTAASTNNEPPNASYWEVFAQAYNPRGAWTATTAYKVDDVVVHLGQSYRCLVNHTASASFIADFLSSSYWQRYASGSQSRGAYVNGTAYFKGDLATSGVAPNLDLYLCLTDHTASAGNIADPGEVVNWQLLVSGTYTTSIADRQLAFFYANCT